MSIYRGTSLIRNRPTLAPYSGFVSRALWWSQRGGGVLMSEALLYHTADFKGISRITHRENLYRVASLIRNTHPLWITVWS